MDPYHAGRILARNNRFRRPSLEFMCLETSFTAQKQKVLVPRDSTWLLRERSQIHLSAFLNISGFHDMKSCITMNKSFPRGFLGSISSRCSGNEPALLGEERRPDTRERRKSSLGYFTLKQNYNAGADGL